MTLSNIDFTCPAFSHMAGKNNRFCKTQGHTENLYTLMMNITEMYNQWRKNVKNNLCLHSTRCGEMKDKNKENEWWQVHSGKDEDIQWVEANPTDYLIAETCAAKLFIA